MVYCLYPESNQRTLEEMNLVFASDSIWNWEAEKNFRILKDQNPELVQAAQRGHSVVDPETGLPMNSRNSKHLSLDPYKSSGHQEAETDFEKQTFKHG